MAAAITSSVPQVQNYPTEIQKESVVKDKIPTALFYQILSYLDLKSLTECNRICRNWSSDWKFINEWNNNRILKQILPHLDNPFYRDTMTNLHPKEVIITEKHLDRAVKLFFNSVMDTPLRSGLFTCTFEKNPDINLRINVGSLTNKSLFFRCIYTRALPQIPINNHHELDIVNYHHQMRETVGDVTHYNAGRNYSLEPNRVSLKWEEEVVLFRYIHCKIDVTCNLRNDEQQLILSDLGKGVHKAIEDSHSKRNPSRKHIKKTIQLLKHNQKTIEFFMFIILFVILFKNYSKERTTRII